MDFDSSAHNMDRKFQEAIEVINQYKEKMLMVIDNVETDKDPILLQVTQYLKCRILVTSRENSFSDFTSVSIPAMGTEDCIRLFYSYYNNSHDDVTLRKIIALADNHTVTVELLAKVADTEEVFLHEFYNDLIRCGFHISDEEAKAAHDKGCKALLNASCDFKQRMRKCKQMGASLNNYKNCSVYMDFHSQRIIY